MKYTHIVTFARGAKQYTLRVISPSDDKAREVAEKAMTRKFGSKLASEFHYISTAEAQS